MKAASQDQYGGGGRGGRGGGHHEPGPPVFSQNRLSRQDYIEGLKKFPNAKGFFTFFFFFFLSFFFLSFLTTLFSFQSWLINFWPEFVGKRGSLIEPVLHFVALLHLFLSLFLTLPPLLQEGLMKELRVNLVFLKLLIMHQAKRMLRKEFVSVFVLRFFLFPLLFFFFFSFLFLHF